MFLKLLIQTWFACEGCGVKQVSSEFRYSMLLPKCGSQILMQHFACVPSRKWSDSDLPELQGQPRSELPEPSQSDPSLLAPVTHVQSSSLSLVLAVMLRIFLILFHLHGFPVSN